MKVAFKKVVNLIKESIRADNEEVDAEAELVKLAEDSIISWEDIARGCLAYMTDEQIRDMAFDEGLLENPSPNDMTY